MMVLLLFNKWSDCCHICSVMLQNLCVTAAHRPIKEILEKEKKVCFFHPINEQFSNLFFLLNSVLITVTFDVYQNYFGEVALNLYLPIQFTNIMCLLIKIPNE
jgi:hypothetical protein